MTPFNTAFVIPGKKFRNLVPAIKGSLRYNGNTNSRNSLDEFLQPPTIEPLFHEVPLAEKGRNYIGSLKFHWKPNASGVLAILTEQKFSTAAQTLKKGLAKHSEKHQRIINRSKTLGLPQDICAIMYWLGAKSLTELNTAGLNRFFEAGDYIIKLQGGPEKPTDAAKMRATLEGYVAFELRERGFEEIISRAETAFYTDEYGILRLEHFGRKKVIKQKPDLMEAIKVYATISTLLDDYPNCILVDKPTTPMEKERNRVGRTFKIPKIQFPRWDNLRGSLEKKRITLPDTARKTYTQGRNLLYADFPVLKDPFLNRAGRVLFDFEVKKGNPAVLFPLLFLEFGLENSIEHVEWFVENYQGSHQLNPQTLYDQADLLLPAIYMMELTGNKLYTKPDLLEQVLDRVGATYDPQE